MGENTTSKVSVKGRKNAKDDKGESWGEMSRVKTHCMKFSKIIKDMAKKATLLDITSHRAA